LFCLVISSGCLLPDVDLKARGRKQSAELSNEGGQDAVSDSGITPEGGSQSGKNEAGAPDSGMRSDVVDGPAGAGGAAGSGSVGANTAGASAGMSAQSGMAGAAGGGCSKDQDCERSGALGSKCLNSMCAKPEPQCSKVSDCLTRGPEYMGGSCISQVCVPNPRLRCEPPAEPASSNLKELKVSIIDALSLKYLPDVHVVACDALDRTCAQHRGEATSDSEGLLKISVPNDFDGYLQQTEQREYVPSLYVVPRSFPSDRGLPNFPLVNVETTSALALAIGARLDAQRGHLILVAVDCFGDPLPGAVFSSPQVDETALQFYVADQVPTTMTTQTQGSGDGGFLNFPVGDAVIATKVVQSSLALGSMSVLVRAGYISVAYIGPDNRPLE
jgi:hypothetical protein